MLHLGDFEPQIDSSSPQGGIVMPARVYAADIGGNLTHYQYAVLVDHALCDYWQWAADGTCDWETNTRVTDFQVTVQEPVRAPGLLGVHLWSSHGDLSSLTFEFRIVSADRHVEHAVGRQVVASTDPATGVACRLTDEQWRLADPLLSSAFGRSRVTAWSVGPAAATPMSLRHRG